jgi:membrane fusion protein (multidrug efflux system)
MTDSLRPVLPLSPSALPAVLLAALLAACDKPAPPPPPPPPTVSVIQVAMREVPVLVEVVGRTEGSKEVEVRARVSGILGGALYPEGSPVRAGAPLFQIDRAPFEIALAQAKAALAQERARNEQTQREAERLKDLIAKRAISQREADDAASNFKTSSAAIQAAEAKVREAELNLSYTAVGAPIAGVTGRALRSQGSLVTAGTESSLLTTVSQTDPLWVRFSLSESERQIVTSGKQGGRGNEVRLVLPDGKTHPVAGRLNFSGSTVDTRLGTVQLRAEFANPDLRLLPGQFVRAQVVAGSQEAIVVPQSAVLQGDAGRFVWTLGPENKATPRPVETGAWLGPDWIIQKGLKPDDKVIVDNLLRLRPGVTVQLQAAGAAKGGPGGGPGGAAGAPGSPPASAPPGKSPDDAKKAG